MRYDKRLGIAIFTILVVIALANVFSTTPLSISDSDASTYVIVPLLMLPLFLIFIAKSKIRPDVRKKDLLLAVVVLVVFVLVTVYLRTLLSYLFISYKVYMLLFPGLLMVFALLLFGGKSLPRFKAVMVYSVLASPLLLMPIINLNQGFTVLNTLVIYSITKVFVNNTAYIPPITISANNYRIGIGQTCVGVGVLIGIVLFLLPVAYLYDGRVKDKALWVFSGFALLLLLNILRMLGITLAWIVYGPSNAILTVHLFSGILLFYLSLIVMVLISERYGLAIKGHRKARARREKVSRAGYYRMGIVMAVVSTMIYYFITLDYHNALYVSPIALGNNLRPDLSNQSAVIVASGVINTTGFSSIIRTNGNDGLLILIWNRSISRTNPIVVYITYQNKSTQLQLLSQPLIKGSVGFIDTSGISAGLYDVISNNTEFFVYTATVPHQIGSGRSSTASLLEVAPANATNSISCVGRYDLFYTYVDNILNPSIYNSAMMSRITNAYCLFDKLVVK